MYHLSYLFRRVHSLKRQLGITAWREFSDDMTLGLKKLKAKDVYHKTEELVQQVIEDPRYLRARERLGRAVSKAHRRTSEGLITAQRTAAEKLNIGPLVRNEGTGRASKLENINNNASREQKHGTGSQENVQKQV